MTATTILLEDLIADLATLRAAYAKAGFITDAVPSETAKKLLGGGEDMYGFLRDFLLVDAVLRNRVAPLVTGFGGLRHLAVFGGNNVGKSTVVNVLAEASVAGVSPKGGHTRHPHAIARSAGPLFAHSAHAFSRFKFVRTEALKEGKVGSVVAVSKIDSRALPEDVVLWDMPDCDAVGSLQYLASVVETVAAADMVLYVTSIERYAVEHMVEWVFCLHDAGIPIVECLNRTRKADRELIMREQAARIFPEVANRLGLPAPEPRILPLQYMTGEDAVESDLWGPNHPEARRLREAVLAELKTVDRPRAGRAALDFVRRHIDRILEPARKEIGAQRGWTETVERELAAFVESYEKDYLSSETAEPFARLNVQILELLDPDVPYLKEAFAGLRKLTRLPREIVITVGGHLLRAVLNRGSKEEAGAPLPPEVEAYADAHRELLRALNKQIEAERSKSHHHPFWDIIGDKWQHELEALHAQFSAWIKEHVQRTEAEIRAAANDILQELSKQPRVLNALRTARVATQVGGAAASVFMFGHGDILYHVLEDVLIAPAIATGIEQATASAVSLYVQQRKQELLDRLRQDARELVDKTYRRSLTELAESAMGRVGALGIGPELIERVPHELDLLQARLVDRLEAA